MDERDAGEGYLALTPQAVLRVLEAPYVYLIDKDELFEVNDEALEFLSGCDGRTHAREMTGNDEFVRYCLSEGILEVLPEPSLRPVRAARSPLPSLRFLELQVTSRCNLACLHCYQAKPSPVDLPLPAALAVVRQFEEMAGLKLLISGGEPMLYPWIFELFDKTAGSSVRRVLITNGTLIDETNAKRIGVDEVQISLDGWERGHDVIRGPGSFVKAVRGLEAARAAGIGVSIATMIHRDNLNEFDRMAAFIEEIGAMSWGIDLPCATGKMDQTNRLFVSPEDAAPFMRYAFGGGGHSTPGFACGHHLMTVLPSGQGVKCGFYADHAFGDTVASLLECRRLMPIVRAEELACRGCPHIDSCGGGCRFRAPDSRAPDPLMCAVFGLTTNESGFRKP
jgi:radical SAM protein with 4Fe4S-binding SPASM domain